ncbi:uncharacterized protein LOC144150249 [Haemaphysalis longicornis]
MSARYKLCWYDGIVYKFKLEWPPESADILHHEQDIIKAVVEMTCKGETPQKLSNGEIAVTIQPSKWPMSGQILFKKDGIMYELFPQQFHMRVQKKDVAPMPARDIPNASHHEDTSSSDVATPPKEPRRSPRRERRQIRLPAQWRRKTPSSSRAVVARRSRRDLGRPLPFVVQNSLQQVMPNDGSRNLTVERHYIPDTIYRALHQFMNVPEQEQDGSSAIIFLQDNVSWRGNTAPAAILSDRSLVPLSRSNHGLLRTIRRGVAAMFGQIAKWLS